ncbi:hypothetical protein RKD38_000346 [Streptomyces ambofaciens]
MDAAGDLVKDSCRVNDRLHSTRHRCIRSPARTGAGPDWSRATASYAALLDLTGTYEHLHASQRPAAAVGSRHP